ncbi:CABIT domain-containing protein [Trichonephila inaurata madagascariensis]|uniref:CABIT domain-containing protein n=1 Tax=Trichonephila inaurata madagascariensis TaxID=2747483 RepID=A0A8X6XPF3_9ARAC|nr:CABIT domain-containing protein [Trichonephila inaurata madagascariensis]GFY56352.1 CABIT domain-containing protein [Trichonephila inaurata madagascariensis]
MVLRDGRTAGFFSSIGEVSRAAIPMFLVQDAVLGLKIAPSGMSRTIIAHGEVLKAIGSYEDHNRQSLVEKRRGNIHQDLMMYLKCLTQKGEIVYLPYSSKGRFYCISSQDSHTLNHVYLISNLLRVSKLPALIRIISGPRPHIALPFTNVIQIEEVRRETIILGCTMVDNEPVLLEVNANSKFSLITAKNKDILQKSEEFKRMSNLCIVEGDRWRQKIRVAHHVIPKLIKTSEKSNPPTPSPASIDNSQNKCRDLKPVLPACDMIDFLRHSYRDYIFPKRFWMFRKNKSLEYPGKYDSFATKLPLDILKAYCNKSKSKNSMTFRNCKDSLKIKRPEKLRSEYPRQSSSDDGYSTSCFDDESIYHSIY